MSNEAQVNESMAITGFIITAVSALGAGVAFAIALIDLSIIAMVIGCVMAAISGAAGWGTSQFLDRANPDRVRARSVEHVLSWRQRQELRRKRSEVVMEKALLEVEHERDNISHRALEAANDETKPPHKTQWSLDDEDDWGRGRRELR